MCASKQSPVQPGAIISVDFVPVSRQLVPVRQGEPLWAGPGCQIFETTPEGRFYVGFAPLAQVDELRQDYAARGVEIGFRP